MHRLNSTRLPALMAGLLLFVLGSAHGTTWNVEHDATADTLQLRDVDTGVVSATSATGCCDVVAGGLDTDLTGNRLFVLDSTSTGQHLVTLALPTLGAVNDAALNNGLHYAGLRFDSSDGQLYALAADSSAGTLALVTLDPGTGASTAIGPAEADCCMLVPGTVALGGDNDSLLAVTRALDDPSLVISSWDLGSSIRTTYAIPAGRHIDGLARNENNNAWLMLYRDEGGPQTLARLELPATVTPMATLADCCMTLASTAVFEPDSSRLRVVARADMAGTLQTYSFGADGSTQTGSILASSIGLVRSTAGSDVIFANGFETVQTLVGSTAGILHEMGLPAGLMARVMGEMRELDRTRTSRVSEAVNKDEPGLTAPPMRQDAFHSARSTLAGPVVPVPALAPFALLTLILMLLGLGIMSRRRQHG